MLTTFSHSSLQTFRNCPRKFKFQYIQKPDIPRRVSVDAYLGNAVHRVLQTVYRRGDDGVELSLETMLSLYEKEWEKVDRSALDVVADFMAVDDYIRMGREMLTRHHGRYRPFKPGTLLGTEMYLSFTLPGTPFKLRAIIDRLCKRADGSVEICDYKTGRNLARPSDPDYFYQMGLYQLAVMQQFPTYREIEVAQYFLRLDEVVAHRMTDDDLDKLTEDIRQAVLAVYQAEKMEDFPTSESTLCNYCEYFHLCPAKRHQQMLEAAPDDPRTPAIQAQEKASEYIAKYKQVKELQAELDALKEDLGRLADELEVNKFAAIGGEVAVTKKREEKFVTKTDDSAGFAELSALARDSHLDDFFKLDTAVLMKEAYLKKRLDPSLVEKLAKFVRCKESTTVRVKLSKEEEEDAGVE